MKLTQRQAKVLKFLANRPEIYVPPTGPEISTALGHVAYWAAGKLIALEKRGLVERVGTSITGGKCY